MSVSYFPISGTKLGPQALNSQNLCTKEVLCNTLVLFYGFCRSYGCTLDDLDPLLSLVCSINVRVDVFSLNVLYSITIAFK